MTKPQLSPDLIDSLLNRIAAELWNHSPLERVAYLRACADQLESAIAHKSGKVDEPDIAAISEARSEGFIDGVYWARGIVSGLAMLADHDAANVLDLARDKITENLAFRNK